MNATIFSTLPTHGNITSTCTPLTSAWNVFYMFALPVAGTVLCLYIITMLLHFTKKHTYKNHRFQLRLTSTQGIYSPEKYALNGRIKVKLIGRRNDIECNACDWQEINLLNTTYSANFDSASCHFDDVTAVCFALSRKKLHSVELFEQCLETCILEDRRKAVTYKYYTSSSLTSSNTTVRGTLSDYRVIIVRLQRSSSFLRSCFLVFLNKLKTPVSLILQDYWSLTSPFLCHGRLTALNNLDHGMILILKILLPLVVLLSFQVYIPERMKPFRYFSKSLELSFWGIHIDSNCVYLSVASALVAFVVAIVLEAFVRITKKVQMCYLRRTKLHTYIVNEATSCGSVLSQPDSVVPSGAQPIAPFETEVTFHNVIDELKRKLDLLGLGKPKSGTSIGLSFSLTHVRKSLGGYAKLPRTNCDNDLGNHSQTSTENKPFTSGRRLPDTSEKEHIYADIVECPDLEITSSKTDSQSSDYNQFVHSSFPSPSVVLLTLHNLKDKENDFLNPTNKADEPQKDNSNDIQQIVRAECKKDCRRSMYKSDNRNSSYSADSLHSISNFSCLPDKELSVTTPFLLSKENLAEVNCLHDSTPDGIPTKPCSPQRQADVKLNALIPSTCAPQNIALHVSGDAEHFARGDCHSPTMEDSVSITSSTKSVRYRDVVSKGMHVQEAILMRGKDYIDNFRDMAKAVIRSLSMSSDNSTIASKEFTLDDYEKVHSTMNVTPPEMNGIQPGSSNISLVQPWSFTVQPTSQMEQVTGPDVISPSPPDTPDTPLKPKMRKQLNHGVTLVYPEAKDLPLFHRVRYWLSSVFGPSVSHSDGSEGSDSDVGCMSNLRNGDDQRQNNSSVAAQNRKQIVSDTFTNVTIVSSLLEEPVHPSWFSESVTKETGHIADIIQTSIFKGMAKTMPMLKSSSASVSNGDVWTTGSDAQNRYMSRNKNNNMDSSVLSDYDVSSSKPITQHNIEHLTDTMHLLINRFGDVEDSRSVHHSQLSNSTRTPTNQNDVISTRQYSFNACHHLLPHISATHSANSFNRQHCNIFTCLYKAIYVMVLVLNCCSIAVASLCVSHLCLEDLRDIWVLYGITATIEIIGLDLLKAVLCSLISLATRT